MDWLIKWLRRHRKCARICRKSVGRLLRKVGFCRRCLACFEVRVGPIDHGSCFFYASFEGELCPLCLGRGWMRPGFYRAPPQWGIVDCRACNGTGRIEPKKMNDGKIYYPAVCHTCGGKGFVVRDETRDEEECYTATTMLTAACDTCGGDGIVWVPNEVFRTTDELQASSLREVEL